MATEDKHAHDQRENATFEFTEKSLTKLIKHAIETHQKPQKRYFFAVCLNHAHQDGNAWMGTKRSDRRDAIRDAIDHHNQTTHHVAILGPFD
ncbi:hypothetical protein CEE37_09420 [candidate division LCP-89 bacterium B3_LCP]|uniref:Uncharacterized protein n=1 Tax=candidate division LCP-89 bacterium B3_LCP TaxID=2012998 RepID=A0A532UYF0_UNCL8|nr:MAG: hypothetical protein CEE37_09420 [candidate division LCP-89 bacterium B3_LCP]